MIRRKNSLGFIEFVRGRYNVENVDGINFLFKQMTQDEIDLIGKSTFEELWSSLWTNKNKNSHQNEFMYSKDKFQRLKYDNDGFINLDFFVNNVVPNWKHPEWGFPKGRRSNQESNYDCALREFSEETGLDNNDFNVINCIKPMDERLIGTNGISYRHIYYVAMSNTDKVPSIDISNPNQVNEIGDIGWFTYNESMKLIRPFHTERKKILTQLYMYLINNISKLIN
jgi:8-oxo-dGTP pyrophosphatase MutT (NUDIX family)